MSLPSGTRFGAYQIVGLLGAGGMGEVYRAKDLRLGRDVALKVLPAGMSRDPDRVARFEREARTVAGLNHPNIVTLFSVEDEGDVRFLTMELVEGRSLSALVAPGGLPLPHLLELAIPLTDALVAAHERGVIHRDLKPGNVMVTREGRVKVLDFGLAKMLGPEPTAGDVTIALTAAGGPLSAPNQVVGTVPYMAPEQLRGEEVDARSDLFALGVVLYELATGHRPFTGRSALDVSHAILHEMPVPLGRVRPDLPGELDRIVGGCLEKNPRERMQTALDASNALRRLRKELEHIESGAPAKPPSDKVASIAVLPFVNRSASADDEYFSDGLADELLNVLSKIKGLRVTARSSAFTFKGKQATAAEIGRALNVATLLEGSVRKAGNRIRVSVQLVQVSDSSHLWSETYDRMLEDIFAVQDDIAHSVVKELRTALLGEAGDSDASGQAKAEVAEAARGRGTDPEAHRLVILARHLIDRFTLEDTAQGIEYLKEAVRRDPDYPLAWAELSGAYSREAGRAWTRPAEGYENAREAANRALALDPDLSEGHARMGWIRLNYDWDFRGAEASYARALELSPGNPEVLRGAGVLMWTLNRLDKAIDLIRRALDQDPLSAIAHSNLAVVFYCSDRFAESEEAYRKALELFPARTMVRALRSLSLLGLGRGEEALAEALLEPDERYGLYALSIVHWGLGHAAESDRALQGLIANHADYMAFQIAAVFAARTETDAAFTWLERARAQRDSGLTQLKANRFLRSVHDDPRWSAFLRKMGLDD